LLPGHPGFRLLLPARSRARVAVDGRHDGGGARRGVRGLRAPPGLAGGGGVTAAGPAIAVSEATKVYRRRDARRPHGTLKSALLSPERRGRNAEGIVALDRVSFELAPGQTLGVIGANGSGKSTLLRLLAGIVRPTRGRVEVRGRLAALLELGAGFHPEISGRENIEITGLLLGLSRKEIARRLEGIVEFAGI